MAFSGLTTFQCFLSGGWLSAFVCILVPVGLLNPDGSCPEPVDFQDGREDDEDDDELEEDTEEEPSKPDE